MADLRHGARGPRPGRGRWAPLRRTGSVPVPYSCRGRGAGTTGQDGERCGSGILRVGRPFGSRARYDDHGTERNLDETVSRPGDRRACGPRSPSVLVTPRDAQPERVTPRCVSVTRIT